MARGIVLDLTPAVDRIDVTEILPSPPPAYSQLPTVDTANFEDADEDGAEEEDEDSSEEDDDDEDVDDAYDEEDDSWREAQYIDKELVNDQDWENASGDLTKRYNRLRQHVGALTGEQGRQTHRDSSEHQVNGASKQAASRMPLPTQNQHHQRRAATSSSTIGPQSKDGLNSTEAIHSSKLDSSLAQLSQRYASALNLAPVASTSSTSAATAGPSHLNYAAEPSFTSNAATRKGGSERHHVLKDKSDRATTEQVLDPRTRLVLFKMLNRGLLEKVEGCVSTGKEVRLLIKQHLCALTNFAPFRPMYTTRLAECIQTPIHLPNSSISLSRSTRLPFSPLSHVRNTSQVSSASRVGTAKPRTLVSWYACGPRRRCETCDVCIHAVLEVLSLSKCEITF
jgi:hypothetical protein